MTDKPEFQTGRRWVIAIAPPVVVLALLAGAVSLSAASPSQEAPAEEPEIAPDLAAVQYSVPFVCGWLPPVPPQDDQFQKPGDYATTIHIENPTTTHGVVGSKRVLLSGRMGAALPPVTPFFNFRAFRFRVVIVDCVDIWAMAAVPPGTFIEGALHIGLEQPLPVRAVYTSQTHDNPVSGPDAGAGHSIDVEQFDPFTIGL